MKINNAENRHERTKPVVIEQCVTPEEAGLLLEFAKSVLPNATNEETEETQVHYLYNRPDAWDPDGVLNKIHDSLREYIKETYHLTGILEPKSFAIMRSDELQGRSEIYGNFESNEGETFYTGFMSLNTQREDYVGGDNLYVNDGTGFTSLPGDLHVHRNEDGNSWEISHVHVGTRFDVVVIVTERQVRARYDEFEIEQTVDDGVEY